MASGVASGASTTPSSPHSFSGPSKGHRGGPAAGASSSSAGGGVGTGGVPSKCRQLPCRQWVSLGHCPYNDKVLSTSLLPISSSSDSSEPFFPSVQCMFMHDFRVRATVPTRPGYRPPRAVPQSRLRRQEEAVDAFFWQTMTFEAVTYARQLDAKNLPAINQAYLVGTFAPPSPPLRPRVNDTSLTPVPRPLL